MKKQLTLLILIFLSSLVLGKNNRKSESDHIGQIKPRKNGDIPPHIRKCMNVSCPPENQCFHGKCIKQDSKCLNFQCEQGFRCKLGECIKQLHQPMKMLCEPLAFKLQKKLCSEQFLQTCKRQVINKQVCGFNRKTRKFYDYSSPCEACSDNVCSIHFYYETTCDAAPRICSKNDQCMNGVCTSQFNDPVFNNYRTCNWKADCKINQECAFHKCIDSNILFNYISSESQVKSIFVKI